MSRVTLQFASRVSRPSNPPDLHIVTGNYYSDIRDKMAQIEPLIDKKVPVKVISKLFIDVRIGLI